MAPRRILVASPVEPSGGSWLLNCLLELGIKVGHKPLVDKVWRGSDPPLPADHVWTEVEGGHVLNPKAEMLAKFLPSVDGQRRFAFRDDVEVEYVQDLPPPGLDGRPLVLVVRDPRDALYSMYRRVAPDLSFDEFCRFPNPATLLGRAAHWALFVAAWLDHPALHVLRFEDYKRDAAATLRSALEALDLGAGDAALEEALRLSSLDRAREAEAAYRARVPHDRQVANRAGAVGEGRARPEVQSLLPEIERATAPWLRRLGYEMEEGRAGDTVAARLGARHLGVFATFHVPAAFRAPAPEGPEAERHLLALLAFAHRLDDDLIRRAGLLPHEARRLIDSLSEFSRSHHDALAARLAATRGRYRDGSDPFFQRIREQRAATRPGPAG